MNRGIQGYIGNQEEGRRNSRVSLLLFRTFSHLARCSFPSLASIRLALGAGVEEGF